MTVMKIKARLLATLTTRLVPIEPSATFVDEFAAQIDLWLTITSDDLAFCALLLARHLQERFY